VQTTEFLGLIEQGNDGQVAPQKVRHTATAGIGGILRFAIM